MNQHPVPQHISSYEFKLVGDMTLKQFFQLAGGVVISLILYATPLPGYIKWPLVIFFVLVGVALAFLPIQERPLSIWFLAFIRAIYSPTKYVYAEGGAEEVFAKKASPSPSVPGDSQSVKHKSGLTESFEQAEKSFLDKVSMLFSTTKQPSTAQEPIGPVTQTIQPRVETEKIEEIKIPLSTAVKVEVPAQTPVPVIPPTVEPTPISAPQVVVAPVFASQNPTSAQPISPAVNFTLLASPPNPPETPNTIAGQVTTADGKIIDGAIMEIRNASKIPVRALRSNKVGHFITVTPLSDGKYEIYTEKEGFEFEIVSFQAEGRLIPPILIKAK